MRPDPDGPPPDPRGRARRVAGARVPASRRRPNRSIAPSSRVPAIARLANVAPPIVASSASKSMTATGWRSRPDPGQRTHAGDRRGHPERAVEPAAVGHRIGVRADPDRREALLRAREHRDRAAGGVDADVQPQLGELRAHPGTRAQVVGRVRHAGHAAAARADRREGVQGRGQPRAVDRRARRRSRRGPPQPRAVPGGPRDPPVGEDLPPAHVGRLHASGERRPVERAPVGVRRVSVASERHVAAGVEDGDVGVEPGREPALALAEPETPPAARSGSRAARAARVAPAPAVTSTARNVSRPGVPRTRRSICAASSRSATARDRSDTAAFRRRAAARHSRAAPPVADRRVDLRHRAEARHVVLVSTR